MKDRWRAPNVSLYERIHGDCAELGCRPVAVLQEPTEASAALDFAGRKSRGWLAGEQPNIHPLVRPLLVIVLDVFADRVIGVLLIEDQEGIRLRSISFTTFMNSICRISWLRLQ
jgi:hypothetical protein